MKLIITKAKIMAKKTSSTRTAGKRGKRTQDLSFSPYIHRVIKQVHSDVTISKNAMKIVNNMISDIFERIASESLHLVTICKQKSLRSRDVQSAVRLVLPS
jgi:histone H2B